MEHKGFLKWYLCTQTGALQPMCHPTTSHLDSNICTLCPLTSVLPQYKVCSGCRYSTELLLPPQLLLLLVTLLMNEHNEKMWHRASYTKTSVQALFPNAIRQWIWGFTYFCRLYCAICNLQGLSSALTNQKQNYFPKHHVGHSTVTLPFKSYITAQQVFNSARQKGKLLRLSHNVCGEVIRWRVLS